MEEAKRVYKLQNGVKEYDNYIHALQVAKVKAEAENTPVTVVEKSVNTYKEFARVHPDGKEERFQ